jgi:protein subunit release factor B
MHLNEIFPVTPQKVEELKNRILRLQIHLNEVEEQFTLGSGHGGQKINKTSNCVVLRYPKLDITVKCQQSRQRSLNRFLALRELVDQIEMKISPGTSERLKEMQRIRKQKSRRSRKLFHKLFRSSN